MPIRYTYNYNPISIGHFLIDIHCLRFLVLIVAENTEYIYLPTKLLLPIVATNHTIDNKYETATIAT